MVFNKTFCLIAFIYDTLTFVCECKNARIRVNTSGSIEYLMLPL